MLQNFCLVSTLECYTCTNVKNREGAQSVIDELYAAEECADDVTGLPKETCTSEDDVCGYVVVKVAGNSLDVLRM